MRITFVMPGYAWGPVGGFRVVYEYANRLVAKGHTVSVVHPRGLKNGTRERLSVRGLLREGRTKVVELFSQPSVNWHVIDSRVRLLYVQNADARHIPTGDAIVATGWPTVRSVLECPQDRGEKFYLIQGYEAYHAPQELVDETWRAPVHKIVIATWLLDIGHALGCRDLVYIPNAIDLERYRIVRPIADRPRRVSMLFSPSPVKGSADGFEALRIVREKHRDVEVIAFGTSRRQEWIPQWVNYLRNPPQKVIVDDIYNQSSIFLCPSLSEGFPLPPAEAAACGCAVVATDIGGIREYIDDGVTGLLSSPKNPRALADNLCLLMTNEELRLRLAHAGHERLLQFSWDRSASLLERHIEQILQVTRRDGNGGCVTGGLPISQSPLE